MKSCLSVLKPFFYLAVIVELVLVCFCPPGVALASAPQGLSPALLPPAKPLPAVKAGPDVQGSPVPDCPGVELSDVGQAVALAIEFSGDPADPQLSGVTCGSFLTPTVGAETSLIRIPGVGDAGDAFQRYTALIAAAEYEVDFTTMTWDLRSDASEYIVRGHTI